jgi:ribosomal protein L16/L10AE
MGKGKGSFDHWASRIAVSKVIFELKGDIHEQVARDAFRLAGNKMPGQYCSSPFEACSIMLTLTL